MNTHSYTWIVDDLFAQYYISNVVSILFHTFELELFFFTFRNLIFVHTLLNDVALSLPNYVSMCV